MALNFNRLWRRVSVYSFAALIVSVVLLRSLIHWHFDETQVRCVLSKALQGTSRTISIEGKITPVLFPSPGIQVEKLSISEAGRPTSFAHVEVLHVGLVWWKLLFGRREVSSVTLSGATFNICRSEDDRLSVRDLFQPNVQSKFSQQLDMLKIRESTLVLFDQRTLQESRIINVNLDADDLSGNAKLSITATLTQQGAHPVRLQVNTPLSIEQNQIHLKALDAVVATRMHSLGGSRLVVSGQYTLNFLTWRATGRNVALTFNSERPSSEMHLVLPNINASLNELRMPSCHLKGKFSDARGKCNLHAALGNLKLNRAGLYAEKLDCDLNWSVGSTKVKIKASTQLFLVGMHEFRMQPLRLTSTIQTSLLPRGEVLSTMSGDLYGHLDEPRFNLRVVGKIDGSDLTAVVSQHGLLKPRHEARVFIGRLDLNRYLPERKGEPVPIFQNTRAIPLDWLNQFDLTGTMTIGELAVGRFRIKQISSDVRINPRELKLEKISADIYEGHLQGDASLTRRDVPQLKMKQTLKGMKVRPLLVDLFNFSRLDGKGNGKIDVSADGSSFSELRNALNGKMQMSLHNGALRGIDLVTALKNFSPKQKKWNSTVQNDQKTTFSSLSSSFRLDRGVARSQDLKLASQLMNVGGGGKIDLRESIVDYTMNVRPNPLAFLHRRNINLPLKITGPLNAPVYALDFNAMVKGKKTNVEKQRALTQQLKKQVTTILP